nr:response regulator transcription factor [Novosphingobium flavum]
MVDDHPLFRQAMAATVANAGAGGDGRAGHITVEQFETLAAVRERLDGGPLPALVLLDLKLPDSQGVSGLLALKAHFPDLPIAIVSASDSAEILQTAMACGAAGFVSKAAGVEELSAAIETLLGGETWFTPMTDPAERPILTPTHARILDGVHRGLMNKQIAHELGLTEATIKYHLTGIFRILGVQTRAQLVALSQGSP